MIEHRVASAADRVAEIGSATEQLRVTIHSTASGIDQIAQSVQRSASGADGIAQTVDALAQRADELRHATRKFLA